MGRGDSGPLWGSIRTSIKIEFMREIIEEYGCTILELIGAMGLIRMIVLMKEHHLFVEKIVKWWIASICN